MRIQENIPLAPLTTLGVGGAARYFTEAGNEEEVREAVEFAKRSALPLFVLGGGSNVVIADSGWPGLALKIALGGIVGEASGDAVRMSAGAGVDWDDFVAQVVAREGAGIECLSGIPGSVGGTPVQNVGAYGQEVSDTIESVRALDLEREQVVTLSKAECEFRYRGSVFNGRQRGRHIILQVSYRLRRGAPATVKYADLQKYFAGHGGEKAQSLERVREAVREIRRSKGMLMVEGDEDCRSAGSFFKNPVVSESQLDDLRARARAKGLEIPSYRALAEQHKVPAAWLVEHSGLAKGYALGRARISNKHALAIVNAGGASAAEVLQLKDEIQRLVGENWGIQLEAEPEFVGF